MKKRLQTISILVVIILIIITRTFASSVLGHSFFGDPITNLFTEKDKPKQLSEGDLRLLKNHIYPIAKDDLKNDSSEFVFTKSLIW